VAALRAAPAAAAALVEQLYVPLDPRLRGAAEASVTAHLRKLAVEGVATADDGGVWRLR